MKFLFGLILTIMGCVALVSAASVSSCQLTPKVNGDGLRACAAFIPSWSFNPETKQCEDFVYGGCGGNANRFPSQEECEKTCKN